MMQGHQWLVRFQNVTHVLNLSCRDDSLSLEDELLDVLSWRTGWPASRLQIPETPQYPFVSVRVVSCLRAGKGGFGTLLKGQSKQAGAKRTTDFGACRDLQGRRLRHVNDEIKLRKWRELQRRKQEGITGGEEEMWKTPSGLYNWHLMVPNWASDSLSKKGTRKMQRQMEREMERYQSVEEKAELRKKEQERLYQQSVADYARQTAQAAEAIAVQDAIQQGLAAAKKRKEIETTQQEEKNSLVTLSGDFVVDETATAGWQLQSKSEFGTMALVLDKAPDCDSIYFEVQTVTGGLAQVGWADLSDFAPDTETGDGVGDHGASYAFDGSRCRKFHNGTEESYGESWKAGDVIGCRYNVSEGTLSYSLNGKDMGKAFSIEINRPLVPALSCNGGEILELHVHPDQMKFRSGKCAPVYDLLTSDVPLKQSTSNLNDTSAGSAELKDTTTSHSREPRKAKKAKPVPVQAEPLDLDKFTSEEQLEELGMDRLKGALMALGVKCGGSLQERAVRLFSLKGLKHEDFPMKVRAKTFQL